MILRMITGPNFEVFFWCQCELLQIKNQNIQQILDHLLMRIGIKRGWHDDFLYR